MPNSGYTWNDTASWSTISNTPVTTSSTNNNMSVDPANGNASASPTPINGGNTTNNSVAPSAGAYTTPSYNATNGYSSTGTFNYGINQTTSTQAGYTSRTNLINSSSSYSTNTIQPEDRKTFITRLYKTILGREPDKYGMNYYLYHTELSEHDIAKDIYESTEHREILDKAKDVRNMVIRLDLALQELKEKKRSISSLESLNSSYKELLSQKDRIVQEIKSYEEGGNPSAPSPAQTLTTSTSTKTEKIENQTILAENLPDPFAELDAENNSSKRGWLGKLFK